jgi:hypothetical protein
VIDLLVCIGLGLFWPASLLAAHGVARLHSFLFG